MLDACRDNPFGWNRSGSWRLAIVSRQPADSIIVYATSAGSTASDGTGRNGLFTSHLLNNLKIPEIDVGEVFRLTMRDVARDSNNMQRPAIYSQFGEIAYLGSVPSGISARPAPAEPAPTELAPAESAPMAEGSHPSSNTEQAWPPKTVNTKRNWLSAEAAIFGIGLRYELMLGSRVSLGVNTNYSSTPPHVENGVWSNEWITFAACAFGRFYPTGRTFFLGLGAGFGYVTGNYWDTDEGIIAKNETLVIPIEIGWKIDAGEPGHFFCEPGLVWNAMFGDPHAKGKFAITFPSIYFVYLGIGYAF